MANYDVKTLKFSAGGNTYSITGETYESKSASSGGTDLSLVTTGEKYNWNQKLDSHQTIKQDGVTGATINRFGFCETLAATATKEVSITEGTFSLETGARITVRFTDANTADTPQLKVGTNAKKDIYHKGAKITTGGNKALLAGVCDFVYDGMRFHLVGNYVDSAILYGACSTAAGTQQKSVTISSVAALETGLSIRVKFANAQDYNGQPTLKLNSFDAKNIVRNGSTAAGQYEWQAGEVVEFVYDGTNFVILEGAVPSTTYYGSRVKLSSATNSSAEDLAATPKAVKTAYDLANGKVSCTTANVKSALSVTNGTDKYLREDGTWDIPPGSKPVVVEIDTVYAPSGSSHFYSNTTTGLTQITAGMKALQIEVSNPDAFQDKITIEVDDGEITLTCNNVVDDSEVIVTCALVTSAEEAGSLTVTSDEFDILAARIATLEAVGTDVTFTIPTSAWSQSNDVYTYDWIDSVVPNRITNRCKVKVGFFTGAEATTIPYLEFEKITGGIRFTSPTQPTEAVPVVVTIYNVKTDTNTSVHGDNVQTTVIDGAVNVDEALSTISDQIGTLLNWSVYKSLTSGDTNSWDLSSIKSSYSEIYLIGQFNVIGSEEYYCGLVIPTVAMADNKLFSITRGEYIIQIEVHTSTYRCCVYQNGNLKTTAPITIYAR